MTSFKNTAQRYGYITQAFHWLIAVALLSMIPFGWFMEGLPASPEKFKFYALHKSVGIAILAAVIMRFFWKAANPKVLPVTMHKPWEKALSHTVHILLYGLMIAMPLSGWLMSSAAGFPVSVFGLFTLPDLVAKNAALGKILNSAHSLLAWSIIIIAGLHIAGALKHHFLDKDNTLRRMLPALLLLLLLLPMTGHAAKGTQWQIVPQETSITFTAYWETSEVTGSFKDISGTIIFAEDTLGSGPINRIPFRFNL